MGEPMNFGEIVKVAHPCSAAQGNSGEYSGASRASRYTASSGARSLELRKQ